MVISPSPKWLCFYRSVPLFCVWQLSLELMLWSLVECLGQMKAINATHKQSKKNLYEKLLLLKIELCLYIKLGPKEWDVICYSKSYLCGSPKGQGEIISENFSVDAFQHSLCFVVVVLLCVNDFSNFLLIFLPSGIFSKKWANVLAFRIIFIHSSIIVLFDWLNKVLKSA